MDQVLINMNRRELVSQLSLRLSYLRRLTPEHIQYQEIDPRQASRVESMLAQLERAGRLSADGMVQISLQSLAELGLI